MITIEKVARKNRHYYLSEKEADNGSNRWFRYVKTMDSYSEPVLLSPKMAQELLESDEDYSLRKPISQSVLESLAAELKSGKYPTVSISFSGKLLDGWSTLHALIYNKKSAIVFLSFNVSDKLSFLFG